MSTTHELSEHCGDENAEVGAYGVAYDADCEARG